MDWTMTLWRVYLLALLLVSTEATEDCSCNGVTDGNDLGQCTKKEVWCYVDPQSPCFDVKVWSGAFGDGWSYSHQACEAQLLVEHEDECEERNSFQTSAVSNKGKQCSCNGKMDDNDGGECKKEWVGELWCYVDFNSGCEDTTVWYGEYGFCKTYSYQACGASSPYVDSAASDDIDLIGTSHGNSISVENILYSTHEEEGCVCNGVTDANKHGLCTKQSVWCYVDSQTTCRDALVWTGVYGYGWKYSYKACDQQLALEHRDECKIYLSNQIDTLTSNSKECSCNGKVDENEGGECKKAWVGKFWCYIDFNSGCKDSTVWYGEHGFCETYSYQACGSLNTNEENEIIDTDVEEDNDEPVQNNDISSTIAVQGCFCNGAIDDNNDGQCSKENVWCYVHPGSTCGDSLEWVGVYGFGWTYSFQACEDQLALEHKDTCERLESSEEHGITGRTRSGNKCLCNGEMDNNGGGECVKAWVGKLWCYVDNDSGCQDTTVWYGEHGFCQTYSYLACDSFNSTSSAIAVTENNPVISANDNDIRRFCSKDWLKFKCWHCKNEGSCTPWVQFQCAKCQAIWKQ